MQFCLLEDQHEQEVRGWLGMNAAHRGSLGKLREAVRCMDGSPADAETQRRCCGTLAEMLRSDPCHGSRIAGLGGAHAAVRAMERHLASPEVQEATCRLA